MNKSLRKSLLAGTVIFGLLFASCNNSESHQHYISDATTDSLEDVIN